MRKQTSSFAIAGLLLAGCFPMYAQEGDWGRAHRVIERTQEDLRHIEHHDVWAMGDRGHYEAVERNLTDIRQDLDRNRLDRGRLDAAIGEIEHITHIDALDGHARERMTDDLHELQRLRDDWHWR
jgi:hypothetical protein